MYKVFVEYKVSPEFREAYTPFLAFILSGNPSVELLEATDQPCLFLEIWRMRSDEEYNQFKQDRLSANHAEWSVLHDWVAGGPAKINVWRFHSAIQEGGKQ